MFTGLLTLTGIVGIGGLSLFTLSALGFGGGLVTWLVAKNIPWKLIAICALALFIALGVFAGYQTFKDTQKQLEQTAMQLSVEKMAHAAEKARADGYVADHDAQVARIDQLEKDRSAIEEQDSTLQTQIDQLHLQQDFSHDSAKAVANFNARTDKLNSLLEAASRGQQHPSRHVPAR